MVRRLVCSDGARLAAAVLDPMESTPIVWSDAPLEIDTGPLLAIAVDDLTATVSPLPVEAARATEISTYSLHDALPPAPTLPVPCASMTLLTTPAIQLLRLRLADGWVGSARELVLTLGRELTRAGLRHVACPGLAMAWEPTETAGPDWAAEWDRALFSAANSGLSTHQLWATTRLRPMRVVLDGACMTADVHTGTQRLVIEVARALSHQRPDASVTIAVPEEHVAIVRQACAGAGVDVVARTTATTDFDVVYRPYQMLRAQELDWCHRAAQRMVVGQLDMIGYSNPSYHPSSELFFLARNLQRQMLLDADAAVFISEFGRRSAIAEIPALDPTRARVVSCGADTTPGPQVRPAAVPAGPFVAVVSATFTHKNRVHALAVFAAAVRRHGLDLRLVIAGPEPFYGRSTDEETRIIETFDRDIRERILHVGQISEPEKWWVLANARAVIYPSTVEGFGLIPFEAASVGTPSLSYCGTALGEILGAGAATVGSWDVDEWADRLAALVLDQGAADGALEHVALSAAEHTWAATAGHTWEALELAVARPSVARRHDEGGFTAQVRPTRRRVAPFVTSRAFVLRAEAALRRRLTGRR